MHQDRQPRPRIRATGTVPPFVVRISNGACLTGTGVVLRDGRILTCRHVVCPLALPNASEVMEGRASTWSDELSRDLYVETADGRCVPILGHHPPQDPRLDATLLSVGAPLDGVHPASSRQMGRGDLVDLQGLMSQGQCLVGAAGYGTHSAQAQWVSLRPDQLNDASAPEGMVKFSIDLDLPDGFSGGPLLVVNRHEVSVIGLLNIGGDGHARSTAIGVARIAAAYRARPHLPASAREAPPGIEAGQERKSGSFTWLSMGAEPERKVLGVGWACSGGWCLVGRRVYLRILAARESGEDICAGSAVGEERVRVGHLRADPLESEQALEFGLLKVPGLQPAPASPVEPEDGERLALVDTAGRLHWRVYRTRSGERRLEGAPSDAAELDEGPLLGAQGRLVGWFTPSGRRVRIATVDELAERPIPLFRGGRS